MDEYHRLVENTINKGRYKENRTDVDTISSFSESYIVDLKEGFPLLTTKDMSGFRWNSLIHELLWYFSGEEHIRNLREDTSIWDTWADTKGRLDTAYGRFWRRYPIPKEESRLDGESWPDERNNWVNVESDNRKTFDQIQYLIDTLKGENPDKNQNSRRLVVNAWHPANAAVSTLPPCHYTWIINIQNNELNLHLTQRSGDIALGVPFNIAAYSLIAKILAQRTNFEIGRFSHTIIDAHIYCGKNGRGNWYKENLDKIIEMMDEISLKEDYKKIIDWIEKNAPKEKEKGFDHLPRLLKQLSRKPREKPKIMIKDKPLDKLKFKDFELKNYNPHPGIDFEVAE